MKIQDMRSTAGGVKVSFSYDGKGYGMQTNTSTGGVVEAKISRSDNGARHALATLKTHGRLGVVTATTLVAAFCAGIAKDAEECAAALPRDVVCLMVDRRIAGKVFANFFARVAESYQLHQLHIVNDTYVLRNAETEETIKSGWRSDLEPSFSCMRKMLLEFMIEGLELRTNYTEVLITVEE